MSRSSTTLLNPRRCIVYFTEIRTIEGIRGDPKIPFHNATVVNQTLMMADIDVGAFQIAGQGLVPSKVLRWIVAFPLYTEVLYGTA